MSVSNLLLSKHNPDVLTCIANLSNDEVFTPPEMAAAMLDLATEAWARDHEGENLWANPNARVLDPFVKTGVFLREATRRFNDGLASLIPDPQERVNHILTKQIYGIAITELTALMARRSVYCSKRADGEHSICTGFDTPEGNIWFQRTEHTWTGGARESRVDPLTGEEIFIYTGRKCSYCGAGENDYGRGDDLETHAYAFIHTDDIKQRINEIFGAAMHFDIVIGNPPYQLSDGGHGTSAAPIYHRFVEQGKALEPSYLSFVIPARWFAGGKGLTDFRETMLQDRSLRVIHDFWLPGDAFPGIDLQGGVIYFLWAKDHSGDAQIVTHYEGQIFSSAVRPLKEDGVDVFIRYNEAIPILKKVWNRIGGDIGDMNHSFSSLVSPRKPFGLSTNFTVDEAPGEGKIPCYWNGGSGYKSIGKGWVSRNVLTAGEDIIDCWKVFVGAAYGDRGGGGTSRDAPPKAVISSPFIGRPGEVSTETYVCVGPLTSEQQAANVQAYLSCKFVRFLIMLHKPSQHATQKVYTFVPKMDFDHRWTDTELYKYFNLTDSEIDFIEWMIRPMNLDIE